MAEYIGKRIVPRHDGEWDKASAYEALAVVLDPSTGDSYTSRKDVPAGIALSNADYWAKSGAFNAQLKDTYDRIAADNDATESAIKSSNEATEKAIKADNDATENNIKADNDATEKYVADAVAGAVNLTTQNRTDLEARMGTIEARLDANVSASTDADADYAAEVVDARTSPTGASYASLGAHIRAAEGGLAPKIIPSYTRVVVNTAGNTGTMEVVGGAVHCVYTHSGESYVGLFAGYFGAYGDIKDRKYRIVLRGVTEAGGVALVTNAPMAWGSLDGTVGAVQVAAVSLTEDNAYTQAIDIDFSEDRWEAFRDAYTYSSTFYFAFRDERGAASVGTELYMYCYERTRIADAASLYAADHALSAAEAGHSTEADAAAFADNYFLEKPEGLLNVGGKRYSYGMGSLDIPAACPYSMSYSFQSVEGGEAEESYNGFSPAVKFHIPITAASSQPHNQGYCKRLAGMLTLAELAARFQDGYSTACFCAVEKWRDCPSNTAAGPHQQNLLISYYAGGSETIFANVKDPATMDLGDGSELSVWAFTPSADALEKLRLAMAASDFAVRWYGIWNTRKMLDSEDSLWEPEWSWQDYAFTDGSYSAGEMAGFFYGKYKYWSSCVNHEFLKARLRGSVPKVLPSYTRVVVNVEGNTGTMEMDGAAVKCTYTHTGESYVGLFAGFFGEYQDVKGRRYRVVLRSGTEVAGEAMVTNARTAWGSTDGTVGGLSLGKVSLYGGNGYAQAFDIDFSDAKWGEFLETHTYSTSLYFCFRDQRGEANEGVSFDMYCYRLPGIGEDADGQYATPWEGIASLDARVGASAPKIVPSYTRVVVNTAGNTGTMGMDGAAVKCTYTHSGSSYVGLFAGFFGAYPSVKDKKYRIVFASAMDVAGEAVVTNSQAAWGSTDGTVGGLSLGKVSLEDGNGHAQAFDIDFSEERWSSFLESHTYSTSLYFCFRDQRGEAKEDVTFYMYCYRLPCIGEDAGGQYASPWEGLAGASAGIASLEARVGALEESQGAGLHITCWGDSLTAGGGWTSTLASLSGATVHNGGTGGENVRTIAARQGADVMVVDGITIPAACEPVLIASRATDGGIATQAGHKAMPLLQGGAHVNPCRIGGVEGTLKWTGSSYADTTGTWTFTRSEAGEAVEITRPTALRTAFDCERNGRNEVMVIFMGQNGGYTDVDDLVRQHRLMVDHFKGKEYAILGLSSGTAESRRDYEAAMTEAFGRRFISLRAYLAAPIYGSDGATVTSCYGLEDAGLTATEDDLAKIAVGQVPAQLLADSVHYTAATKTVIGKMLYKRMSELGIFD